MKKLLKGLLLAAMPMALVSCGGEASDSEEEYDKEDEYAYETDDSAVEIPSWAYGAWAVNLRDDYATPMATNYFVINKDGSGHWYIVNPDGSFTANKSFECAVAMNCDDYDVILLLDDGMSVDQAPMAFIDYNNRCLVSNTGEMYKKRSMINFMYD